MLIRVLIKAMNICECRRSEFNTKRMYEWHFPLFRDDILPQASSEHRPWLHFPASQRLLCPTCESCTISRPLHTQRHHLIWTSSVQLTKCRLENKWQTPGQINYVSSKMLASAFHAELPSEHRQCVPYGLCESGYGFQGGCRGHPLDSPTVMGRNSLKGNMRSISWDLNVYAKLIWANSVRWKQKDHFVFTHIFSRHALYLLQKLSGDWSHSDLLYNSALYGTHWKQTRSQFKEQKCLYLTLDIQIEWNLI